MEVIFNIFVALIMGLGIAIAFSIYLFPWIIAYERNLIKKDFILVLNILFGFTLIGWGACLLWAMLDKNINKKSE
jgi:hypothetical protein